MTEPLFTELQPVRWTPTINTKGPVDGIIIGRYWQDAHPDPDTGAMLPDRWVYKIQSGEERDLYDVEVAESAVQLR